MTGVTLPYLPNFWVSGRLRSDSWTREGRFHDEVRSSWDALAAFWDERIEAGRTWQRNLIYPPVERLLELEPGERVLAVACGNGELARRMAERGGHVLAVDSAGQ
jgi:cyclopropane fatty-acyl-phospholipid synthase-like methyltransferase